MSNNIEVILAALTSTSATDAFFDHRALLNVPPVKIPTGFLSRQTWSVVEILGAFAMLMLSFVQKSTDHSQSVGGLVGLISYVGLIAAASFGMFIMWDGAFVYLHANEMPRPILCSLLLATVWRQTRQILYHVGLHGAISGNRYASALIETPQWIHRVELNISASIMRPRRVYKNPRVKAKIPDRKGWGRDFADLFREKPTKVDGKQFDAFDQDRD